MHRRTAKRVAEVSAGVVMRWLGIGRIGLGIIKGIGLVFVMTVGLTWLFAVIPLPSAETLESGTEIGIVLVLAYVVEVVWLVPRIRSEPDYEDRLGSLTGVGVGGMVGVLLCVLVAAHRTAGHANLLDIVGTAWVAAAFVLLAGFLVAQPLLVHDWEDPNAGKGQSS